MSSDKPELENAIRIAIEAADAANSSAADIAEMKRQYTDAASQMESQRKNFTYFSLGVMGSLVVVVGACGFIFFKTMSESKRTNATSIEALNVLTQNVSEIRTTLAEINTVNENMVAFVQSQETAMGELSGEIRDLSATLTQEIATMANEAVSMQPQFATTIQEQVNTKITDLQSETAAQIADLQVALSKMLAQGFSTLPSTQAKAPVRATPTAPKRATTSTPKKTAKKAAPRPPSNPFKFP